MTHFENSFETLDARLLPGFDRQAVSAPEGDILAVTGGSGPPLLMLHGDPQTHLCWHHIAPVLARDFTVVLTDLRGRGESHKPGPTVDSIAYSKRASAAEQLHVMQTLSFDRFRLVGHDRGARVARRMALDHPQAIERLAVMDIVPALDFYTRTTAEIAQAYFYFYFLTQPHPLPETLIRGDAAAFMSNILTGLSDDVPPYDPDAFQAYLTAATTDAAITAMCECFRAGLSQDIHHDRADRAAGRTIHCPTLVMWGSEGVIGQQFDMPAIWSAWAPGARFAALTCGHFIPEDAPGPALEQLTAFLA